MLNAITHDQQNPCNLCGSKQFRNLFDECPVDACRFYVTKCEACGLIATNPIPTAEFLTQLYDSESYQGKTVSGTYCLDEHISSVDFGVVLGRLRLFAKGRRLLDVGCGAGAFVHAALAEGWDSYGVEPSPYASKIAKTKLADRVEAGFLENSSFATKSFDVITLWYVLEHVVDPTAVLKQCSALLESGGLIFVAVPNARYILLRRRLAQLMTGTPGTVHAHEHLYQYTTKTLKQLMEKSGFSFEREDAASPYMISGTLINIAKHLGSLAVSTLLATTGINMGGILMFGRKRE